MPTTQQQVSAWNATLAVEELGREDGPTVVVLHSEEGPRSSQALAAELGQDYRVVLPYIPGFGETSRVEGVDRPNELAYLLLDLLDARGVKEAAIVGTSLGAWIALEAAAMNPGRFTAIVAISPVGVKFGGYTDRTFGEVHVDAIDRITARLYNDVELDPWKNATSDDDKVLRAEQRESFMHYTWEPYLHSKQLKGLLPRVSTPTLILNGSGDGLVDATYYKNFADLLPKVTTETISNAGHYPEIEQLAATAGSIKQFLAANNGQGRNGQ